MSNYSDEEFWKALESRRGYTRTVNRNKKEFTREEYEGYNSNDQRGIEDIYKQ